MDIRVTGKDYRAVKKAYDSCAFKDALVVTRDDTIRQSLIMVQSEGRLVPWTFGRANIVSYLRYGVVRIRRQCPFIRRRCRGDRCQLYQTRNSTGDCALVWSLFSR